VNEAHGSDHPFQHATCGYHHKSDQRLKLTLPSLSHRISKALIRIHPRRVIVKLRPDAANHLRKLIARKSWATLPGNASGISAIEPKLDVTRADVVRKSAMRPSRIATTVNVARSIAKATALSQLATRDPTQAVEFITHCNQNCKLWITLNSLQHLTGWTVLGMITGAKFLLPQQRMIPCIDTLRKFHMNTDVLTAATCTATRHGNIESQTERFRQI